MRPSARQLARYFEPGTPTGLAGLWTHATPRSTLLYLYGTMLSKLQTIPESSLYRQSVEAVAKQRMGLVEQIVPPGYQEWAAKAQALLKDKPGQFKIESGLKGGSGVKTVKMGDRVFVIGTKHKAADVREEEWDGEPMGAIDLRAVDEDTVQELQAMGHFETRGEETTVEEDGSVSREHGKENAVDKDESQIKWESEPQLTPEQVKELEAKIGAGLLEEVIQVAESELRLIDSMKQAQVWEDLEEKPVDGQWEYFERKSM